MCILGSETRQTCWGSEGSLKLALKPSDWDHSENITQGHSPQGFGTLHSLKLEEINDIFTWLYGVGVRQMQGRWPAYENRAQKPKKRDLGRTVPSDNLRCWRPDRPSPLSSRDFPFRTLSRANIGQASLLSHWGLARWVEPRPLGTSLPRETRSSCLSLRASAAAHEVVNLALKMLHKRYYEARFPGEACKDPLQLFSP